LNLTGAAFLRQGQEIPGTTGLASQSAEMLLDSKQLISPLQTSEAIEVDPIKIKAENKSALFILDLL
jgi:hypothetical protein